MNLLFYIKNCFVELTATNVDEIVTLQTENWLVERENNENIP